MSVEAGWYNSDMDVAADLEHLRSLDAISRAYRASKSTAQPLVEIPTSIVCDLLNARYYDLMRAQFLSQDPGNQILCTTEGRRIQVQKRPLPAQSCRSAKGHYRPEGDLQDRPCERARSASGLRLKASIARVAIIRTLPSTVPNEPVRGRHLRIGFAGPWSGRCSGA